MSSFKKTLLGAVLASTLLFTLPAQEAKAGSITLTPPASEFYYTLTDFDQNGTMDYWQKTSPDPYLQSQDNTIPNEKISYMQFAITDPTSIFADPSTMADGHLSLFLKDVAPDPALTGTGTLSIYRVDDSAVYNAANQVAYSGQFTPIALGNLLSTKSVDNSTWDDQTLVFDFIQQIHSTMVAGTPYLSFAIVANADPGTDSILSLQYAQSTSLLVTPAPEPMSISYILLGCCAFVLRRVKRVFGLA